MFDRVVASTLPVTVMRHNSEVFPLMVLVLMQAWFVSVRVNVLLSRRSQINVLAVHVGVICYVLLLVRWF